MDTATIPVRSQTILPCISQPSHPFLFLEILTTIFWLHLVSILTRLQNDNSWFLQVRTLFVSGLPMDTKPRELYLLFRAYEVQPKTDNILLDYFTPARFFRVTRAPC